MVAAAGGQAGHGVLERCAPDALGPALREALDAGLLVRDDAGVALRHGLIGEVIYAGLVPAERTALHQAIAVALQEEGAPAAQLADQWHRAGAHAAALDASLEAGARAADAYAFAEASAHYERALTLWDVVRPAGGDRVDLLSRAAQAARHGGDQPRALALGRAALAAHDRRRPRAGARLYERLGEYLSWDDEAALECYAGALALLGDEPTPDPRTAARGAGPRADGTAPLGGVARALRAGARRGRRGRRRRPGRRGADHPRHHARLPRRGGAPASGTCARRSRPPRARTACAPTCTSASCCACAATSAGARAMELGERAAARLGMRGSFGCFMYVNAIDDLLRLGRWDEAEARLQEAERMDLGVTAATMLHASAAQLHALRGEATAAREHLEHARACEELGLPASSRPRSAARPRRSRWPSAIPRPRASTRRPR